MKMKQMKSILSTLQNLKTPNPFLEQYSTPPDIALDTLNLINRHVALKNKTILDMCCGTGMLMITSLFYDPLYVAGIDVCEESLRVCKSNIQIVEEYKLKNEYNIVHDNIYEYPVTNEYKNERKIGCDNLLKKHFNYDLIRADCSSINFSTIGCYISNENHPHHSFIFDICLMNPPFGTVQKKIDTEIINNALKMAKTVFVLHSSHVKPFLKRKYYCEVLADIQFELKRICFYHKKDRKDVGVSLFKVTGKRAKF